MIRISIRKEDNVGHGFDLLRMMIKNRRPENWFGRCLVVKNGCILPLGWMVIWITQNYFSFLLQLI